MQSFDVEKYVDLFRERVNKVVKPRKFIGLAVEDNAILAVDAHRDKDRFTASLAKAFIFPKGVSLIDPEGFGKALGQFLQENRFSARKAIIGIPAKWLMLREKVVSSATDESIAGILKIYAEREFSLSPEELSLDYTGVTRNDGSRRLFLSAMLKGNLDKAILAARWAGLDVLSVTVSSSVAFSGILAGMSPPAPRLFLYLRDGFAEFLVKDGDLTVDIKHIGKDFKKETASFISELRRIISNYSHNSSNEGAGQLLVWNASSVSIREELKSLSEAMSGNIRVIDGNRQTFTDKLGVPSGGDGETFIAPVMFAWAFNRQEPFYVDFLNSRMNLKASVIKRNQVLWASAAAACLLVLLSAIFFMWRGDKKDVSLLNARFDGMKGDMEAAKEVIQKVNMAAGWYSKRPGMLDCIKALTMTFPEEGTIWITNLALTEEMKGVMSGRATDEKSVIDILDKLKASKLFSDVQMIYLQDNSSRSQEVSFSMNFSYEEKE
ncbi:MAG: hypothetical protein JW944_16415 [Deltaproteobacteria bacterium]|nr:hypothetical protein [Deltaproteobacteria bacterium]